MEKREEGKVERKAYPFLHPPFPPIFLIPTLTISQDPAALP